MNEIKPEKFLGEISKLNNPHKIDSLWAILKYKEIGILRKIMAMASVMGLDDIDLEEFPKDPDTGRIIDKKTRHLINETLIQVSQNGK